MFNVLSSHGKLLKTLYVYIYVMDYRIILYLIMVVVFHCKKGNSQLGKMGVEGVEGFVMLTKIKEKILSKKKYIRS